MKRFCGLFAILLLVVTNILLITPVAVGNPDPGINADV
jgi:hypothetical protein